MSGEHEVIYVVVVVEQSLDFLWYTSLTSANNLTKGPLLLKVSNIIRSIWKKVLGILREHLLSCVCVYTLWQPITILKENWVKVEIELEFLCKQLCLSLGCCNIVWSLLLFVQNLPNDINVIVFNNKVSDHSNCKQTSD